VRSARLPIGRYLASLQTRKVLTVNQVFEILVKWVETRDWEQAFYAVIPKRKFQGGDAKARDQDEMDDAGDVVLAEPEIQDPDTSQVAIADV
jgi:tRNA (guanine9-N1)-methyltransferase